MASKIAKMNGTRSARKTAPSNGTRRGSASPRTVTPKRPGRRESWQKALERNLILVGYSPAEAKELVELAAA